MPHPLRPITQGAALHRAEVGGFIVTESAQPAGMVLPPHAHEQASLAFVLSGSFEERLGRRAEVCSRASLIVKPAGQVHSNRYGPEGARCLFLEVAPGRLAGLPAVSSLFARPLHLGAAPVAALAAELRHELAEPRTAAALAVEGLSLEILAAVARALAGRRGSPAPPAWLPAAIGYLRARFAEPFTLEEAAAAVGVHPASLARGLRRHCRCSVGEYVRRLRLAAAAEALAGSDRPLAEIALACGFYDQSHLTRAFGRHYGLTPARFRADRRAAGPRTRPPSKTGPGSPA